ncbi:unnamed protein product, partial [Mesorhabditis belari]
MKLKIWRVEDPYVIFNYFSDEYKVFCGRIHTKRASCIVLVLSFLLSLLYAAEYLAGVYLDDNAIVLFAVQLICVIILAYSLHSENQVAMCAFLILQGALILSRYLGVARAFITIFEPKSEWSYQKVYKKHGIDRKEKPSHAIFHIVYLSFIAISYSIFFYIVYR